MPRIPFFLLINVEMPTIVGISTFVRKKNFMLRNYFITSGPGFSLRSKGTPSYFLPFLQKGNNLCHFLSASLENKTLAKRSLLSKKELVPREANSLELNSHCDGMSKAQVLQMAVASPEMHPFTLKPLPRFFLLPETSSTSVHQKFFNHINNLSLYIQPCTIIHRYSIFSTRYSVMCNVYTGYCGTSEIEHGLCACTVDKAGGLSLYRGTNHSLSLT